MIVYIFWHWPERTEGYEDGLVEFHRRLTAAEVPGLAASATYRVEGLPWLGAARGYEDWYVVGGFSDLEVLNREAVAPPMRTYHDRPALAAAGVAGGLYGEHSGAVPGVLRGPAADPLPAATADGAEPRPGILRRRRAPRGADLPPHEAARGPGRAGCV